MKIKLLVNHASYSKGDIVEAESVEMGWVKTEKNDFLSPDCFTVLPDDEPLPLRHGIISASTILNNPNHSLRARDYL